MTRSDSIAVSHSDRADVVYEIPTPFELTDAKILLTEQTDGTVEVIIGSIPVPADYDKDNNLRDWTVDENTARSHGAAKWIIKDSIGVFDEYDWEFSKSRSHSGNVNLQDIYFTCDFEEVDEAVMKAKKFITKLEEQSWKHRKEFDKDRDHSPSKDLRRD